MANFRLSYFFILIGIAGLLGQGFARLKRDKELLQNQIHLQKESVFKGLNVKWSEYLLKKARAGDLESTYKLLWNRVGTELRSEFFPIKKITLDWTQYREAQSKKDLSKLKTFLHQALARTKSWDRVLALNESQKIGENLSPDLTEYEKSIFDPRAAWAYREIFEQFSSGKDFTFTSNEILYDKVFYSIQSDGSIEAFVPGGPKLIEALRNFVRENQIAEAPTLEKNPWQLKFSDQLSTALDSSFLELSIVALSLAALLLGFTLYLKEVKRQKKYIDKRVSFLNQVMHELKTPLAGLKLHLQIIQRGSGTKSNYLALSTSIDRVNRLFDDVVFMNRPLEKITPISISAGELNLILEDLKSEFNALDVDFKFTEPLLADPKRLRFVLRNLVKNAIQYGKRAKLSIKQCDSLMTSNKRRTVDLFVQDEGPGIKFSEREKIFDEFYRSDSSKNLNPDGLGLGLFLVKKLSTEMNVNISLLNNEGPGAIFRIEIPREDSNHA